MATRQQYSKLIKKISEYALIATPDRYDITCRQLGWIGPNRVWEEDIAAFEKRLTMKMPTDLFNFYTVSNGLPNTGGSTSCEQFKLDEIDWLMKLDDDLVELWGDGDPETAEVLKTALMLGGVKQDTQLLMIPQGEKWVYWKFAFWMPGYREYKTLLDYYKDELKFLKDDAKEALKNKIKPPVDYTLRDAVFALNWEKIRETCVDYIKNQKENPPYYYIGEVYKLALIAAFKLDKRNEFVQLLKDRKATLTEEEKGQMEYIIGNHLGANAADRAVIQDEQDLYNFTPQTPPKTLEDIEEQIKKSRKDLLKEKNAADKLDYQISFLFYGGNASEFARLDDIVFKNRGFHSNSLMAARVYLYLGNMEKTKECIMQFVKDQKNNHPFEPYLDERLLPVLEEMGALSFQ